MTDQEQVTIRLFGSPDDAGGSITKFHEALAVVTRDLGEAGIMYSQRRMNSNGVGVSGYALGLLTIPWCNLPFLQQETFLLPGSPAEGAASSS